MKKNYEKWSLWIGLMIITYFILAIFIGFIQFSKINIYKTFQGIVIKENLLEVVVTSKELELFQDNSYFYVNNKKYHYLIKEVNRDIIKDKNKKSHLVLLEIKNKKWEKGKDIVTFSIFQKKLAIKKIFKIIWKEDLDGEA